MQALVGVRRVPPSNDRWGFGPPTRDRSSGLKLEVRDFPSGVWSTKIKDSRLGRAFPGLDLRRSELQAQLCPFLVV